MRPKKPKPNENLLGCESEEDLRIKLFEKSSLVFPEYEMRARKNICKHLAKLVASKKYSGDELASSDWARNPQLIKHLKNMAKKGFLVYGIVKNKGALKLNMEKIKSDWLNLDHPKTNDELKKEAFWRAEVATNEILKMRQKCNYFNIACRLEFLFEDLKSNK